MQIFLDRFGDRIRVYDDVIFIHQTHAGSSRYRHANLEKGMVVNISKRKCKVEITEGPHTGEIASVFHYKVKRIKEWSADNE